MKNLAFTLLGFGLLASCVSQPASMHESDSSVPGGTSRVLSSDLRVVHVLEKDGTPWIVSEPPPDSAISTQGDFDLSLSLVSVGGGSESGGDQSGSATENMGLAGRTPSVVLGREMLYRLNEMAFNTQMNADAYQATFEKVVSSVAEVAKAEMQVSTFSHTFGVSESLSDSVTAAESVTDSDSKTEAESTTETETETENETENESGSGDGQ